MKNNLVVILLVIALLCATLPFVHNINTVKASPATIYVPGDYASINAAISAANPGDTIIVSAGTYSETLQISKSITISAVGHVIVQGGAMFTTHYGNRQAVIFVTGASNVVLDGLDVEGVGLGGGGIKSYTIIYESSTGTIQGCTASPNTIGDVYGIDIAAWDNSVLTVTGCTIENFGRVGVYTNNATVTVNGNTIVGQPYTDPNLVNYGIEIEDYNGFSIATITNNVIYDCGTSVLGQWSSGAIIVDIWRYYNLGSLQPSTVQIENNNIHDNQEAIESVSNSMSYAHYNNIVNNYFGVAVDTDENGNYGTFDARFNWWGSSSGPVADVDYDSAHVTVTGFLTAPFAAQLYTNPTSTLKGYGDIGTNFNVDVKVQSIQDFFGFDINITWDNTLITLVSSDYTQLSIVWPGLSGWFLQQSTTGVNGNTGWYRLVAVSQSTTGGFTTSGSQTLFTLQFHIVKGSNVATLQTPIHFAAVAISNSAWTAIPATIVDGSYQITATKPSIVYQLTNTPAQYVYGKTFQLQVSVTNVCSQMTGFSITIAYDTELFNYVSVDWTGGVLGIVGTCVDSPHGTIVATVTGASAWTGNNGLLFTLTFQVQFDSSITHIWRASTPHDLTRNISLPNAQLTFTDGTLSSGSISLPTSLSITVHLIQGDVNCDGKVDIFDLQKVAQYYDKTSTDPSWASTIQKYDLNNDGSIDLYDLVIVATNFGYGI